MLSQKQKEFFVYLSKNQWINNEGLLSEYDDKESAQTFDENYRNVIMCRVRKKLKKLQVDLRLILNATNPYSTGYINPLEHVEIKRIYDMLDEHYSNGRYA